MKKYIKKIKKRIVQDPLGEILLWAALAFIVMFYGGMLILFLFFM